MDANTETHPDQINSPDKGSTIKMKWRNPLGKYSSRIRSIITAGLFALSGSTADDIHTRFNPNPDTRPQAATTPAGESMLDADIVLEASELETQHIKDRIIYIDIMAGLSRSEAFEKMLEEMGLELEDIGDGTDVDRLLTDDVYAISYLAKELKDRYAHHQTTVEQATDQAISDLGIDIGDEDRSEVVPLQNLIEKVEFVRDGLGNPGIRFSTDTEAIITALQDSNQPIVNMSWQPGETELILEVKREVNQGWQSINIDGQTYYHQYDHLQFEEGILTGARWQEVLEQVGQQEYWELMAQATNGELSQEIYDQFVKEGKINPKDFVPDPTEPIFHRMPGNHNLVWDAHTDQFIKTYYSPISIDDLTTEAEYLARQKEYQNVENPEIIIHEAFAPPKAAASLTEMYRIQSAYPQKIFIVAGGNTDSDIAAAIANMSGQMQENGLIIGPFLSNFTPGPGAHAHLDIKKMHSSSQSVGYTSGIMAWLLSAGASQHEALTAFQTSLTDKWVDAREGSREIHVFDQSSLSRLKQNFR